GDHEPSRKSRTHEGGQEPSAPSRHAHKGSQEPIAIIGASCRLPGGVTSLEAMWQLLLAGHDAITEVPPERWDVDRWFDPDPAAPGKSTSRWGGFVSGVEAFDARLFRISPGEAPSLDPHQRLLLEVAWESFEHAGIAPDSRMGSDTGVFVGASFNEYYMRSSLQPARINGYSLLNTSHAAFAGRLSYAFGLEGPSVTTDTACSSSLVSVHLACQALRARECSLALAGGANYLTDVEPFIALSKTGALSPSGRCRSFSATADGYVRADGCGLLVLKRLAAAQLDGDRILAVIRGSAVNQDGRSNGFTAPRGASQAAVSRAALAGAGIEPTSVGFVECHGTGTPLGDPVEVQALASTYRATSKQPLIIGTLKSNIGHAEAAAGILGLLKAALAVHHGQIPGNLHTHPQNEAIEWASLPVEVATQTREWPTPGPRRAGVSSFGLSGTNAHVVVEEPPRTPSCVAGQAGQAEQPGQPGHDRPIRGLAPPLLVSGDCEQARVANARNLAGHLDGLKDLSEHAAKARVGREVLSKNASADQQALSTQASALTDHKSLSNQTSTDHKNLSNRASALADHKPLSNQASTDHKNLSSQASADHKNLSNQARADTQAMLSKQAPPSALADRKALSEQAPANARAGLACETDRLAAIAWTLATGRSHLRLRAVALEPAALASLSEGRPHPSLITGEADVRGGVVFVFPGQGGHWAEMGRAMLEHSPVFRAAVAACDAALTPYTGWSVSAVLRGVDKTHSISRTEVLQPTLFAVMIGLAKVWEAAGVWPDAVIGSSQGEVAAAYIAGALSLDEAARIVAVRAQEIQRVAGEGAMATVNLDAATLVKRLADARNAGARLWLGAVNSPAHSVISGAVADVEAVMAALTHEGLRTQRVAIDFASHTPMIEGIAQRTKARLADLHPQPPQVAFFSTVHPGELPVLDASYWADNLSEPIRFADAVAHAASTGLRTFIEVSPHPLMMLPLAQTLQAAGLERRCAVAGSLRRDHGPEQLLRQAAKLHVRGVAIDWSRLLQPAPRVPLPTYAFQRQRYWLDKPEPSAIPGQSGRHSLAGTRSELPGGTILHTLVIGPSTHPHLADHKVGGEVVLAGATLASILLAVAEAHWGTRPLEVEGLTLLEPVVLGSAREVSLVIRLDPSPNNSPPQSSSLGRTPNGSLGSPPNDSLDRNPLGSLGTPDRRSAHASHLLDRQSDQASRLLDRAPGTLDRAPLPVDQSQIYPKGH
ncbi:MAG: type I polyketide synthase, partial [Nannocystaceae bacterium]